MRSILAFTFLLLLAGPALGSEEPAPDAVLAEVPFMDFPEPNRIFVDLAPQGHRPLPLILDTGATYSVVTPVMARSLGVSVRRTRFDPYRRSTRLGRDLLFFVDASLSDTGSKTGWEYGVLGGNFLAEYVVELDFPGRRVRFLDPGRYEVPRQTSTPGEAVLPLLRIANRLAVEIEVDGARFPVMLDTGAHQGLILGGELAEQAGVARRPDIPYRFVTAWGEVESELGASERLAVGPFVFEKLPVVVLPNGWFNFGLAKDAVIGVDLLSQFSVRIDYPRERLWLRRRPEWAVTWMGEVWDGWPKPGQLAAAGTGAGTTGPIAGAATRPTVDIAPEELAPARIAEAPQEFVWLELGAPGEGEHREGRASWVEVQGWAGSGTPTRHDVIVVVDVSGSTAYASGTDVDCDGKLGRARRRVDHWRSFNPRHLSSDPGDTVLAAELVATRRLLERLDPVRTRVALVSFSDGAQLLAPVGSDGEALAGGLGELEENFGSGWTNLSAAIDLARKALLAAGGKGRQKSMLILSDGYPTAPGSPKLAGKEARARAEEAQAEGVRIYSFALGLNEIEEDDIFAAIATHTGGRFVHLEAPGEIVHELPRIDLSRVAGVEIENRTLEAPARGTRIFPDGSFDGYVKLTPGENVIRVTARGAAGGAHSVERRIYFERREPSTSEEEQVFAAEEERLKQALALRALETKLAAEALAGSRANEEQRRELEVGVEQESDGE